MYYIFKKSDATSDLYDNVSTFLSLVTTVVYSASRMKLDRTDKDRKSFLYTRNNSGPELLPRGKPIFFYVKFTPCRERFCFLSDNYPNNSFPLTPLHSSLSRKIT